MKFPGVLFWYPQLSNIGKCEIGSGTIIHSHVWIADKVRIGKRCKIEAFAFIPEMVEIDDDVFIGPHVCFTNDKNPPTDKSQWLRTLVKKQAVIGAGAVILPGVTIGERAVIGAGAVVTKNVPNDETWVGNPAHAINVKVGA